MLPSTFAVLKGEKCKSRNHISCFGGFVDDETLSVPSKIRVEPTFTIVVDAPPDTKMDHICWDLSDAKDIRREFSDGVLFEGRVSLSEFNALKYTEGLSTYNTQLRPIHLYLLQSKHTTTSPSWSILSIDIETSVIDCCAKRTFPDAEHDPILQISFVFQERNANVDSVRSWVCSLDSHPVLPSEPSSDIHDWKGDYTFEELKTEKDLLRRFVRIIHETDPDLITGWNVLNFDMVYIMRRAELLGVRLCIGRDFSPAWSWERETHTRAHGTRVTNMCEVHGRIVFDSMSSFQRILNEPSYKLQSVSLKYLGGGKDDMPYDQILPSMVTSEGRIRVANYCFKDSLLVIQLLSHFKLMYRYNGISSVTGVTLNKVIHGGMQVRCFSALLKEVYASNLPFAFPNVECDTDPTGYEGATVISPKVGATEDVIATLDFAALYPNIMRAYNMCWSTVHVCADRFESRPLVECPYHETEESEENTIRRALSIENGVVLNGSCGQMAFVQNKEGLIPRVQGMLYTKRKAVKREMKEASGLAYEILDAYQLALKLVMNSMYGLLGAKQGYLPDVRIASSITCVGRMLIEWSRTLAEKHPKDLSVWGGDTDSIFVHAPGGTCRDAGEYHLFWDKLARQITETYGHPALVLEYEKMYMGEPGCLSWVLVAKKRYAGYKWDAFGDSGKLVYTGLECKRRDFCTHLSDIMKTLLLDIFTKSIDVAFENMHDLIIDAFSKRNDVIEGFVLSKQYFKKAEDYSNPQAMPHVQVALRTNANVGARIDYIICENKPGVPPGCFASMACSRDEFTHGRTIDIDYYFEKQFQKPLARITDAIDLLRSRQIWFRIKQSFTCLRSTHRRKRNREGFTKLFFACNT